MAASRSEGLVPLPGRLAAWLLALVALAGLAGFVSLRTQDLRPVTVLLLVVSAALAGACAALLLRPPARGAGAGAGAVPGAVPGAAQPPTAPGLVEPPFAEALERLPDPLMIVRGGDPDDLGGRRIVFANAAARALLRVPREDALLVAAIRRPEVLEAVDESLYARLPRSASLEIAGAQDRAWRLWTWPLEPGPAAALSEHRALLLMRDETDARRSERTRVDFLANASHELRTPLASLSGFIETLRGHAKEDPVARERFLRIMADQAARMARLVEDLLQLSRVELSEHLPPDGVCDLALTVADAAAALQPLAAKKGVRFALRLPARGEACALADRDQLLQVAQNLLDNALKYAPADSEVEVEVRGPRPAAEITAADAQGAGGGTAGGRASLLSPDRDAARAYVSLRVRDRGPGMERAQLPRLAERFFRVEGQKSGDRPGTGLGLAIVKHILTRHHGGLLVESAPGAGSAFTAYAPAAAGPVSGPVSATVADPGPEPARDVVVKTS